MHHSAQCSVVHDRVVQLSSAQLGLARLRSTWLSSTPLGSAQHGSWQQQDSSMAPLGLGSARHCQLSSAQLSSHHGPWMANDSPRSRAWVWALRHQPRAGSPSRARDSCTPTGRPSSDSCTPTGRPSSLATDGDPSRRLGTARPHCSGRPSCQRRLPSVREAHSGG